MAKKAKGSILTSQFTPRERVLLYCLLFVVILVVGLYFLIMPAANRYLDATVELENQQANRMEIESAIAGIDGDRQAIGETKTKLAKLARYYYEPMLNEYIDILLADLAQKHRLNPEILEMSEIVPYGYLVAAKTDAKDGEKVGGDITELSGLGSTVGVLKLPTSAENSAAADGAGAVAAENPPENPAENPSENPAENPEASKTEPADANVPVEVVTSNEQLLKTPGATTIWVCTVFMSLEGDFANMAGFIDEISKTNAMYITNFTKTESDEDVAGNLGENLGAVAATTAIVKKNKLNVEIQVLMYQDELGENKLLLLPE